MKKLIQFGAIVLVIIALFFFLFIRTGREPKQAIPTRPTVIVNPKPIEKRNSDATLKIKVKTGQGDAGERGKDQIIIEDDQGNEIGQGEDGVEISIKIPESPFKMVVTGEGDMGIGYTWAKKKLFNQELDSDIILSTCRVGIGESLSIYKGIHFGVMESYDFKDQQLETGI